MVKQVLIYTVDTAHALKANKGYQSLLASLALLNYQVKLTHELDSPVLCGAIVDKLLATTIALPTLSANQLMAANLLVNYLVQVIAVARLNELQGTFKKAHLIDFHSRYKYLLLAYSQADYRQLGSYVAQINQLTPSHLLEYRNLLLKVLAKGSTISNHVNTLKHIQGYFRCHLSALQKQQLIDLVSLYRTGKASLVTVLNELNHYLALYPNDYLSQQYYLSDYPKLLSSCISR